MRRLSISRSPPELLTHCKSIGMRLLVQFCRMALKYSALFRIMQLQTGARCSGTRTCADDCVSLTYTVCVLVNSCREHCQVEMHAKWKSRFVLNHCRKILKRLCWDVFKLSFMCVVGLFSFNITTILQHIVSGWNVMIQHSDLIFVVYSEILYDC